MVDLSPVYGLDGEMTPLGYGLLISIGTRETLLKAYTLANLHFPKFDNR